MATIRKPVRRAWDAFKLRLPIAGALYTEAYMFQLFSSLGLLLESRVPHLEAFEIAVEEGLHRFDHRPYL